MEVLPGDDREIKSRLYYVDVTLLTIHMNEGDTSSRDRAGIWRRWSATGGPSRRTVTGSDEYLS